MNAIAITATYNPMTVPGDNWDEKLDNICIPVSQFIADMQSIGCQVTLTINGKPYPIPQPHAEQEEAS